MVATARGLDGHIRPGRLMHGSGDGDLAVPSPCDDTKGTLGSAPKFIKADDTPRRRVLGGGSWRA
jgi:hypothetical protein